MYTVKNIVNDWKYFKDSFKRKSKFNLDYYQNFIDVDFLKKIEIALTDITINGGV